MSQPNHHTSSYSYSYYRRSSTISDKKPAAKRRRRIPILSIIVVASFIFMSIHANHNATKVQAESPKAITYSKSQTVCLDPGHGGQDPGALSNDGSISERDINLTVALDVQATLERDGYRVYMTRTTNEPTMNNNDRYTYCNNQHATIMVSIHHNDFSDDSVDYGTALFYKDSDQALATSVLNATSAKLGITNDGIAQFNDGVLSKSTMPATVSEGFFITSAAEFSQLTSPHSSRLHIEAEGIVAGIENYFANPKASQSVVNPNPRVLERND